MFHFRIEQLEYKVKFDSSCYYPITFNEERRHTKILFGACFGWWWTNSISIAHRPNDSKLDKIDLFAYTYSNGWNNEEYAGSIDIEKNYRLRLVFERQNHAYRIQALSENETKPAVNFLTHYKYPIISFGYSIQRTYGSKILLEQK